jgi:hypothetical protein
MPSLTYTRLDSIVKDRVQNANITFVNWPVVWIPKECRGLGILNSKMNIVLMLKWVWKLYKEKLIWSNLVRDKYKDIDDTFTSLG